MAIEQKCNRFFFSYPFWSWFLIFSSCSFGVMLIVMNSLFTAGGVCSSFKSSFGSGSCSSIIMLPPVDDNRFFVFKFVELSHQEEAKMKQNQQQETLTHSISHWFEMTRFFGEYFKKFQVLFKFKSFANVRYTVWSTGEDIFFNILYNAYYCYIRNTKVQLINLFTKLPRYLLRWRGFENEPSTTNHLSHQSHFNCNAKTN